MNTGLILGKAKSIALNVFIVLLLDGFILGVPSAIGIAMGRDYIAGDPAFSILRFLRFSIFTMVTYAIHSFVIFACLAVVCVFILRFFERSLVTYVGLSAILSCTAYLIYAYGYSFNAVEDNFFWKLVLKLGIGAFFGFLYYRSTQNKIHGEGSSCNND